ncbi:MAG TPA: hypothetical protein DCY88_11350 [Cyanobacteria bacterium UBA11372]|nr:hypothetical protein [Cyanobacteria bacterium UBA11372]
MGKRWQQGFGKTKGKTGKGMLFFPPFPPFPFYPFSLFFPFPSCGNGNYQHLVRFYYHYQRTDIDNLIDKVVKQFEFYFQRRG